MLQEVARRAHAAVFPLASQHGVVELEDDYSDMRDDDWQAAGRRQESQQQEQEEGDWRQLAQSIGME